MTSKQFETLCLYYTPESPPSRHVLLTAKVLGIELNLKPVNLQTGEHLKPEFLKLNPQHQIPVLTDNEFVLCESRVIMMYLAEKYGKTDQLYPKDVQLRAKINQLLYFDLFTLLAPVINYYMPLVVGEKEFNAEQMSKIEQAFQLLDTFLVDSKFAVGEHLTLADIALASSVATAVAVSQLHLRVYKNVYKWYRHIKNTLPEYDIVIESNCRKLKSLIESKQKSE